MSASAAFGRRALLAGAASLLTRPLASSAQAPARVVFGTNWRAQAEHGGFYHALASGIYRARGLDVTIRMGGPQINNAQLLAAGRLDFIMGASLFDALNYVRSRVPIVTVDPSGRPVNVPVIGSTPSLLISVKVVLVLGV